MHKSPPAMPLTGLEHLLVLTDDLEASRDFYCEVLGLREGERPPLEFAGHWLYLDGVPCVHLALRSEYAAHAATLGLDVSPPGARTGAVDHVAFNATGYEEIVARLAKHGIDAVENRIPAAELRQLFVLDPNGVRVEINVSSE